MFDNIKNKYASFRSFLFSRKFLKYLLAVGILLRLRNYLENRSLWVDEAVYALDISAISLTDILQNLSIFPQQPAHPIGFKAIVKSLTLLLGNNEFTLRLWPFLCGVLSLIAFYYIVKRVCNNKAAPICLGLFVFSEPLVYYSSELKYYSSDVFFACWLFLLAENVHRNGYRKFSVLIYGLFSIFAIWLSYACLFVFAGIGLVMIVNIAMTKNWKKLIFTLLIFAFWLLSFKFLYDYSLKKMMGNDYLLSTWSNAFMSSNNGMINGLLWIGESFIKAFGSTLGLSASILALGLFCIGCYSFVKSNKSLFFYLISPVLIVLLMGILNKYPFSGRLILFISPCLAIMIGEGIVFISKKLPKYTTTVTIVLLIVLFYTPLATAGQMFLKGRAKEEIRPVMEYFAQHYRKGDFIYINNSALYGFGYYHGQLNFGHEPIKIGKIFDLFRKLKREFLGIIVGYDDIVFNRQGYLLGSRREKLIRAHFTNNLIGIHRNKRSWFIFSHMNKSQKKGLLNCLDSSAIKLQEYKAVGASIYLYDLSDTLSKGD